MIILKVAPVFLLFLVTRAEKKIELQDIENDNLKSEKEKDLEKSDPRLQSSGQGSGLGSIPLDFLRNGFLKYFENPTHPAQPSRYVHQYAVTEPPERPVVVTPKIAYGPPAPQQAMVGYLSNVPMQIYLVPQYYSETDQGSNTQPGAQYNTGGHFTTGTQFAAGVSRVAGYPSAPEAVQTQNNYIEVPTYVTPTAKTYVPQYSSAPVAYISYAPQPTTATAPTIAPVVYQVPVVPYPAVVAPQTPPKGYYQNTHYQDTNAVEEVRETVEESPKQYSHTDVSYAKAPNDYPRYYNSRPSLRDEYRHNNIQELPHPNPILLKGSPPHLAHIPKALPMYRPLSKPVYTGSHYPGILAARPSEPYGVPSYKRRPTSLLDSYIPSSLQVEYMKRGFTSDPLVAYENLSSGRHFSHSPVPRHYERGFLPNQMYHTAGGGVTYGHYKRTPKIDKVSQK